MATQQVADIPKDISKLISRYCFDRQAEMLGDVRGETLEQALVRVRLSLLWETDLTFILGAAMLVCEGVLSHEWDGFIEREKLEYIARWLADNCKRRTLGVVFPAHFYKTYRAFLMTFYGSRNYMETFRHVSEWFAEDR